MTVSQRATAWNAVLLIDEADVWLEKRSDTDVRIAFQGAPYS